jgi:DNA mismatch repair protein MutS
MAEMSEMSAILRAATPSSLVIADEVGRGTAAADGLAISAAVVEHLHGVSRCRTLFATHYHELHLLGGLLPGVACHHMAVGTDEGLVYAHRVLEGPSDGDSRGVFVARLAGMPDAVTARADAVLGGLRGEHEAYKRTVQDVFRRELLGEARK